MKIVQHTPGLERQFAEICNFGLDKREFVTVNTHNTPNTDFTVTHEMGFTPVGYIVISMEKEGYVWNGNTAWTSSAIYLRSNAANSVIKVLVF